MSGAYRPVMSHAAVIMDVGKATPLFQQEDFIYSGIQGEKQNGPSIFYTGHLYYYYPRK